MVPTYRVISKKDAAAYDKQVRVIFDRIAKADEARLRIQINLMLRQGQAIADEKYMSSRRTTSNARDDIRVIIKNILVPMVALETTKLVTQEFYGVVWDISAGGGCFAVPPYVKLQKGGTLKINLDFVQPPISVVGKILGLK